MWRILCRILLVAQNDVMDFKVIHNTKLPKMTCTRVNIGDKNIRKNKLNPTPKCSRHVKLLKV